MWAMVALRMRKYEFEHEIIFLSNQNELLSASEKANLKLILMEDLCYTDSHCILHVSQPVVEMWDRASMSRRY